MSAERTHGSETLPDVVSRKPMLTFLADPVRWVIALSVVVYLALFAFNSVTRTGKFASDSMNYVNVARNIMAGKGITQPTLGFNQSGFSLDEKIPAPMTAQAPLYPILIALLGWMRISVTTSALLLPALAYSAVFFAICKLATELYDEKITLLAIGVLAIYEPLRSLTNYALSDVIGLAFGFTSLWLVTRYSKTAASGIVIWAGLAGGLAFATRYALLPVAGVGALYLLISSLGWKRKLIGTSMYVLGFAIPAGIVWAHNYWAKGSAMSVPGGGGGHDLIKSIRPIRLLFQNYLGPLHPAWQAGFLGLSLLVFSGVLLARRKFLGTLHETFFLRRRFVLLLWGAAHLILVILIITHSRIGFDPRFMIPTAVALTILWAALAVRTTNAPLLWIRVVVAGLLIFAIGREALIAKKPPRPNLDGFVALSPRLSWLAKYTTDQDLIIGRDSVDVSFFLHRPFTMSFSSRVYTNPATYEKVVGYAQRHCHEFRNIYLILPRFPKSEEQWRSWYGDFFADVRFGHLEKYPEIFALQQLEDGFIFQISCL